jgi:hypothetical protein
VLERFLQPDLSQSTGLFSYVYANDDPLDNTDPMGEAPWRNCGPDMIYCGGMPGGEVDQPTNVSPGTPCYYNPDDCAWSPSAGASPANDPGGFASTSVGSPSVPTALCQCGSEGTAPSQDIRSIVVALFVPAGPVLPGIYAHAVLPFGGINQVSNPEGDTGYATEAVGGGPRVLGITPEYLNARAPVPVNFMTRFNNGVAQYCSGLPYPDSYTCNYTYDTNTYYSAEGVAELKDRFSQTARCVGNTSVQYDALGNNSNRYAYTALVNAGLSPGPTPDMVNAPGWGTVLTGTSCAL